jgi:hypothetical protein
MPADSNARLSFAAPQRLQRKHNLAGLPPEQMLITAETVKSESRQSGQAQEGVRDVVPSSHRNSDQGDIDY